MIAVLALTACPKDETESDETAAKPATTQAPATTAAPTTSAPTTLAPEAPGAPGIEAKAKAELDGKEPDAGFQGTALSVTGSKVTFTVPTGWKTTKSGAWHVSTAADEKGRFAAGSYASGDDTTAKITEAATAASLTECKWSTPESISLGKDKLPATVSDGACKRGGTNVKAVAATLAGTDMNVIAVGGWDEGADSAAVFNTFRSAKKAGGGGDPTGIAACCAAIRSNGKSAPLAQQGVYASAAAACDAVRTNPQGRAALATARGILSAGGGQIPAACQ
jgi:hypothetical protein